MQIWIPQTMFCLDLGIFVTKNLFICALPSYTATQMTTAEASVLRVLTVYQAHAKVFVNIILFISLIL